MATGSDSTLGETIEEAQRNLVNILEKHRQWLDPHVQGGVRADLSGQNLRGLSFREVDLQRAILGNAQLYETDLYGASLREVDLQNVEGLAECQLAGTDLSNAKLPPNTEEFASLEQIKDISVQARTLLWVTITACVFAIVSMSMTSDAVILSHIGSTLLPVVNINVPIGVFFWFWPVVLLGLYLYLHFQLQYLWNGLASLPSFFPNGVSLDERAYPLFLRSLVRLHVPLLKKHRPPQWWLQASASILSAWGPVPFTILLFWIRYLRMHEVAPTSWHIALLALASWFGLATYNLAVSTLNGKGGPARCVGSESEGRSTQLPHTLKDASIVAVIVIVCLLVSGAAFCIEGKATSSFALRDWPRCENLGHGFKRMLGLGPDTLQCFGETQCPSTDTPPASDEGALQQWIRRQMCADFSFGDISHKPDNWLNLKEEERRNLLGVKGALLTNVNLQGADGHGAFLVDATLDHADLQGADFSGADLRKADLTGAALQNAQLRNVDLRGAHLDGCRLQYADLKSARLSGLSILQTPVSDTSCPEAPVSPTSISGADLKCANLYKANLKGANLEGSILQKTNLPEAYLEGANLRKANLEGAILRKACLKNVDFEGATLTGADLSGADLSGAQGLTDEQLKEACADIQPIGNIRIRFKPCCPGRDEVYDDRPPCRPCR